MTEPKWHLEPISRGNLAGLARCHLRCFPTYFLSNLGLRFVTLFYEDFLESPVGLGFVAVDGASGEVVGLVVGNLDGPAFRQWSLRRNRARKALLVFGRLFCSLPLWGQSLLRGGRAALSILRRLAGRRGGGGDLDPRDAKARLLSIGVIPERRGSGIAADLIRRFEDACAARGETRVGLSVLADNDRAIRFYEKSGWVRLEGLGPGVRFVKELGPRK
jgi:ribosomal protein S18 acetylase RimI-like enzyme